MAVVHCRECHQEIDKSKTTEGTDWVQPKPKFYYHVDCYEMWNKKLENLENPETQKTDEEYRKDIYYYLTNVLKVSYDAKKVGSQINTFINSPKNNIKNPKGILFALIYYYGIKNGDWSKSEGGIGIVPFIFDDAREYWRDRKIHQDDIIEKIEKQMREARIALSQEKEIIIKKEKRKTKVVSFNEINELEEE